MLNVNICICLLNRSENILLSEKEKPLTAIITTPAPRAQVCAWVRLQEAEIWKFNAAFTLDRSAGLCVRVWQCEFTYRKYVCPIVLPHLQQGHHHLMKLISRQNPITVHIKHFKANWKWKRAKRRLWCWWSTTPKHHAVQCTSRKSNTLPVQMQFQAPVEVLMRTVHDCTDQSGHLNPGYQLQLRNGLVMGSGGTYVGCLCGCESTVSLTFLSLSNRPPAACGEPTRDLFKVDVIVPVFIKGVKQAWKTRSTATLGALKADRVLCSGRDSKLSENFGLISSSLLQSYADMKLSKYRLTFTQWRMNRRRDERNEGFQVKAAGSGLSFQQPVALLQVYNVRLLHCSTQRGSQRFVTEGSDCRRMLWHLIQQFLHTFQANQKVFMRQV